MKIPTFAATRYAVPLREGGSLPAIVEVEDGSLYVAKFRGAGQGARALIAELLAGQIAHHLGLPIPELALIDLDASFGRTERDPEIQDILKASQGPNVGLWFLEGALNYDPVASVALVDADLAADIVWFDAFITNIDRTPRNPNIMVWGDDVFLIDHGAALYFHHNWDGMDDARINTPFAAIKNHVLLPVAGDVQAADARLAPKLDAITIRDIVAAVPDALLMDAPEGTTPPFETAEVNREAYIDYLTRRVTGERPFVQAAIDAQQALKTTPRQTLAYRR